MPLPTPNPEESQEQFLDRCMGDEAMVAEYEDEAQRYAVCNSLWEQSQQSARGAVDALLGDFELRSYLGGELRVLDESGKTLLLGLPGIPYDRPSEDLGGFIETINPHALDDTLDGHDVICCREHDDALILGRVSAGTLRLENTPTGLNYACVMSGYSYVPDLIEAVNLGDIRGSSFRFSVIEDRWETTGPGLPDHREVLRMMLYEIGPVAQPAYTQTTLTMRAWLRSVGVDAGRLGVAVRRARSGALRGQDIDIIASAVKALSECLPSASQGASGAAAGDRQGLELLRKRLQLLEI